MQTIVTETQTASYRTIHDILRFTPRWPDPKSCCGALFCVFDNKDKCWEAINGVRSTYNDSLRSAIDVILDDEEDRLGLDIRYRPFFCHSIYMVGRKQKRSNPVIFFCCEDASLRIRARDVVKASGIMTDHAAIRLGHASFPPELNAPPRFAAEAQARMDLKDDKIPLQSAGRLSSPDIREGIPTLPDFALPFKTISRPSWHTKRRPALEALPTSPYSSNSLANTITPSETVYSRMNSRTLPFPVVSTGFEESEPKSDTTAEKVQQVPSIIESSLVGQHPSTFLSTTIEDVKQAGVTFSGLFYSSYPMKSLCGVQVTARRRIQYETRPDRSWPEEDIKMTIGGAILIDGDLYGLTVAHGFLKEYMPAQDNSRLVRSVEYDGDSGVSLEDSDDSEDENEPMGKSAVRSSSLSRTRQDAEYLILDLLRALPFHELRSSSTLGQIENQKGKGVATGQEPTLSMMDAKLFGTIAATSIHNGLLGLDWALVVLSRDTPSQGNEYLYDNKVSSIHGIAKTLPSRSPVLAILARGSTYGMILGTSVSMRLPGSRKMCEVWTVNLNKPIEEGDCGALVINPSNGHVYGHIVAGNIGTGFAYVIPFYHTQLEICRQLGSKSKPTFATAEDYRRWMSLRKEETLGIRVSSTFDEGPKATAERVLNQMELQQQDTSQPSSGVELVNVLTKNNPLVKEEDTDYRLVLGSNKGRDQIAYEHFTEKNRTSDEAALPKVEQKPRTIEEEALRPTFRTAFRKALAPRASHNASGSLGKGKAGHINQPASTSSAEGNERTRTEVEWMPNLDSKAAESAPTSSPYTVSGVSKSEMGFNMPTVLKPGPSSKFSAFVKKVLHPKQKSELPNLQISTGEYLGLLPGLPEGSGIWTAVGPARDLWNQLAPHIYDLLAELPVELPAVAIHSLTMGMFMVGKTVEATSPTIFVMCKDKTIHKRAVKLVEQSSILDQFPGVKILGIEEYPSLR